MEGKSRALALVASISLGLSILISLPISQAAVNREASLQESHKGSLVTDTNESCPSPSAATLSGIGLLGTESAKADAWHFVLPGNNNFFEKIDVVFSKSGGGTVAWKYEIQSFAKHAYVYTKASDNAMLVDAWAEIAGTATRFVLSHTCAGEDVVNPGCVNPVTLDTLATQFIDPIERYVKIDVMSSTNTAGWSFTGWQDTGLVFDQTTGQLEGKLKPSISQITLVANPPIGCTESRATYTFSTNACAVSFSGLSVRDLGTYEVGVSKAWPSREAASVSGTTSSNQIMYSIDSLNWDSETFGGVTGGVSNGISVGVSNLGWLIDGVATAEGLLSFIVTATLPGCSEGVITVKVLFVDKSCNVNQLPSFKAKSWPSVRVGTSMSDEIVVEKNSEFVSTYEVQADSSMDMPPGLSFIAGSSKVGISGRFSEAGTFGFWVVAKLKLENCPTVRSFYTMTVLEREVISIPTPPAPPPTSPTASPSPSPTPAATNTPEPEPTPSGEASPSASPTPVPTVTVFVTASPTSTPAAIIPNAPVPTPTPARTFEVVEQPPTSARSKSVVSIQCGEVITLNLKELTKDGSTFEITSFPKTGRLFQPNPDTLIYIPDKENCEVGGNDTFSYAMTDKNGNVKTVERVVQKVSEGDVPKWIRTGYVEEKPSKVVPIAILFTLVFLLLITSQIRRKTRR